MDTVLYSFIYFYKIKHPFSLHGKQPPMTRHLGWWVSSCAYVSLPGFVSSIWDTTCIGWDAGKASWVEWLPAVLGSRRRYSPVKHPVRYSRLCKALTCDQLFSFLFMQNPLLWDKCSKWAECQPCCGCPAGPNNEEDGTLCW